MVYRDKNVQAAIARTISLHTRKVQGKKGVGSYSRSKYKTSKSW